MEQKIKQDSIHIGENIRRERLRKGIGQTELGRQLQLAGVEMTRETLVKIERGTQGYVHQILMPSLVKRSSCRALT